VEFGARLLLQVQVQSLQVQVSGIPVKDVSGNTDDVLENYETDVILDPRAQLMV